MTAGESTEKRIFISVDIEGVAGIATLDQILRGGFGYPRAQKLMTEEANAAIRGAFTGGADRVVVTDSHGTMDNLLPDVIDRRALLVTGAPRPACMVEGIAAGDAMAIFVGYHGPAGAAGVLAHSFSSNFTALRVNGEAMTEAEVNGLYAAALGVPVGVVTGDGEICRIAERAFPGVRTVEVKQAVAYASARSLHPEIARERIEAVVAEAVASQPPAPVAVPEHLLLEVDFNTPLAADFAATVPGSERSSARTLRREVESARDLVSLIMAWYYLAGLAAQQWAALAHRR